MRKAILFVVIVVCVFVLTNVSYTVGGGMDAQNVFGSLGHKLVPGLQIGEDKGVAEAETVQPSASAATPAPTAPPSASPEPTPTPSPTPVPTPTPAPAPSEPTPYTMAWLDKFAPGSVASLEEQVGDNGDYNPVTSYPPAETFKLVVDYHNQCVYAFKKDAHGNFTVLERVMICTTGGNGHWTPEGTYHLGKNRVRFGYFPDYHCYAQYWSQMFGSFYFHSLLYSDRKSSAYSKSAYNLLGRPGSHGCIRLMVPDARWIYYNCAPGTLCIVTTEYAVNQPLKNALRKGYTGAIDYVPPSPTPTPSPSAKK